VRLFCLIRLRMKQCLRTNVSLVPRLIRVKIIISALVQGGNALFNILPTVKSRARSDCSGQHIIIIN